MRVAPKHLAVIPLPMASDAVKRSTHDKVMRAYAIRDSGNAYYADGRSNPSGLSLHLPRHWLRPASAKWDRIAIGAERLAAHTLQGWRLLAPQLNQERDIICGFHRYGSQIRINVRELLVRDHFLRISGHRPSRAPYIADQTLDAKNRGRNACSGRGSLSGITVAFKTAVPNEETLSILDVSDPLAATLLRALGGKHQREHRRGDQRKNNREPMHTPVLNAAG
jgi:hypothetical protein